MLSPTDSEDTCQVCNQPSFGFHFAVASCRACSAFFRRAISTNRQYKCYRKGECKIENRTINCRACRLAKCFRVGMRAELVQNRLPSTSKNDTRVLITKHNVQPTASDACTIISMPRREQSVIEKMTNGFLDYSKQQVSLFNFLYPEKDPNKLYMVSYNEYVEMERGCVPLLLNILDGYFPAFPDFDLKLKTDLFQTVSRHFSIFYQSFRTIETFKDPCDWRFLLHHGQILDCRKIDFFHQNDPNPPLAMKHSLMVGILYAHLIKQMRVLEIRDFEMAALFGIKLFNEVSITSPSHAEFAEQQRNRIYKWLYADIEKNYHLPAAGPRFGKILLLMNYVEPIINQLMENDALNKIFNVFSVQFWED